jgi:hypothetical protein
VWKKASNGTSVEAVGDFALGWTSGASQFTHLFWMLFLTGLFSGWFNEVQSVFRHNHAQAGASPELRTLFYRLANLLHCPAFVVFVFDGSEKVARKRGKKVVKKPHWLTNDTKRLIEAFGFSWYTVSFTFVFVLV